MPLIDFDFGSALTERFTWTVPKLFMLVALRHAEGNPDHGHGVAVKVSSGQTALARSLSRAGLAKMGRAKAPDNGNTVALTPTGRLVVDTIVHALQRVGMAARSPG